MPRLSSRTLVRRTPGVSRSVEGATRAAARERAVADAMDHIADVEVFVWKAYAARDVLTADAHRLDGRWPSSPEP